MDETKIEKKLGWWASKSDYEQGNFISGAIAWLMVMAVAGCVGSCLYLSECMEQQCVPITGVCTERIGSNEHDTFTRPCVRQQCTCLKTRGDE